MHNSEYIYIYTRKVPVLRTETMKFLIMANISERLSISLSFAPSLCALPLSLSTPLPLFCTPLSAPLSLFCPLSLPDYLSFALSLSLSLPSLSLSLPLSLCPLFLFLSTNWLDIYSLRCDLPGVVQLAFVQVVSCTALTISIKSTFLSIFL